MPYPMNDRSFREFSTAACTDCGGTFDLDDLHYNGRLGGCFCAECDPPAPGVSVQGSAR